MRVAVITLLLVAQTSFVWAQGTNPIPTLKSASPTQAVEGAAASITLNGSGFITSTVILVNGVAVPTTYQSATSVIAQIATAAGSSGNLAVQAQNPSPGGGTSSTMQLPIATLQLSATDPLNGANASVATLGVPVTFTAVNTDTAHGSLTWTVQGAGAITGTGVYTPPQTMPANASVTVTVYLTSLPALTASYSFTLVNPTPTVTSAKPTQLLTGGAQTVTLTGSGFVPGTTALLNGTAVPLTYVSYTQASAAVTVAANATGSLTLQVQNPAPTGGAPAPYTLPIAANSVVVTSTAPIGTGITLGSSLNMSASVSGSISTAVTWSVNGGGTISTSGAYVAPITMPNGSVTITAALTSNPSITGSYSVTFTNPMPTLSSANPAQALAGATAAITLTGTGFVPGTVILVNGAAVATTYQSATSIIAQIPAAAASSGNLAVLAQNPTPGGGAGDALQLPIATLQITATNSDGSNTGSARLGVPVSITTTDTDAGNYWRTWTLQGAGTLTPTGTYSANATYTPPQQMPANSSVVVTVYLTNVPALTTSYAFTLANPIPTVSSAAPTQLLAGGTQTVMLAGSGFVAGTTVAFNGTTLPTTYVSYNSASIQVPVANNATGTLSFQAQNPTPGGGAGMPFTVSVAPASITLTATGPDGVNTGFAMMDFTVAFSAAVSGSAQTGINWSVVGPGSISSSGVYTPPSAFPNTPSATITATLASNPAVTTSYPITIANPVPTIASANPNIVAAGTTTSVTLTGTGFVSGTLVQVNGTAVTTTYVSPTSINASISVDAAATGSLSLQAYTSAFTGGLSDSLPLAISSPISATAAARLLDQTTFGPTTSLIQHVQSEGINAWLEEQLNTPPTLLATIPTPYPSYCGAARGCQESEWWQAVLTGNDQLRQRVAYALSEIFVVSSDSVPGWGTQYYANMLTNDAFTNWYTIMTDVTLSPAMGIYLDMLDSAAPSGGLIANENFARENMQLFSLGLNLINQDGSLQLDANNAPIPAYGEDQVQAFARAFTGWTYANADGSKPPGFAGTANYILPMVAIESQHDETSKTLLNGTTLSAGQTAEEDLAEALGNVFNHPNVPPFVSQQLIQHLVKSNPSPAYVSRVAEVFINDGNNVRGDMQAVLTAIFTDPEARAGDTNAAASDGHLREPILWVSAAMRGLGYVNVDPNNYYQWLSNYTYSLAEEPYASPSVFNFFSANYVIPGSSLAAPEFGIENTGSVVDRLNLADKLVANHITGFNVDLSATSPLGKIASASGGSAALVKALNSLFLYGTMDSTTAAAIQAECLSAGSNTAEKVRLGVYLTITSTPYKILH